MSPSDSTLRAIFGHALEIQDTEQRSAYLAEACAADSDLRRQIDGLLAAEASAAHSFLPSRPINPKLESLLSGAVECALVDSAGAGAGCVRPGDRIIIRRESERIMDDR